MTLTLHVLWWYWPLGLALLGLFFVPSGSGGFVIACLLWLISIGMVVGHFLS